MLDARQIRDSEFLKNGVKRRAKVEAQQFIERTATAIEQLQNENASVRAENIDLAESNARLIEMSEKLENEKALLLQKFSEMQDGTVDMSFFQDGSVARAEIGELTEQNTRLSEMIAKLESEKVVLLQQLDEAKLEPDAMSENGIVLIRTENSELVQTNERLKELIAKLEDEKVALLGQLDESKLEPVPIDDNAIVSVRAENSELTEYNARLRELIATLENEKEGLLQQLSETSPEPDAAQDEECASLLEENRELTEKNTRLREAIGQLEGEKEQLSQELAAAAISTREEPAPVVNESQEIIRAAQEKAKLILEKAERDYLLKITRANAAITQKTMAFELEFGDSLRKLKATDAEAKLLKAQLGKLIEQLPDGISENAEVILERLKKQ